MNIETRPLSEVIGKAIGLLVDQMGPANTARFINYFSVGHGNYTDERKETFSAYTVEDVVREIVANEEEK